MTPKPNTTEQPKAKEGDAIIWRWKKNAPCPYVDDVVTRAMGELIEMRCGFNDMRWFDVNELDIIIVRKS